MVSSAQVKPYEGRAEAFIHPFPKVAVPTATTSALAETSGRKICRKVQGKPCFCDGKKPEFTMVFFSQRPQKMFEDVWIIMDHITIYYRPDQWGRREHTFIVGMVLHHSYKPLATIQGLERTHIP